HTRFSRDWSSDVCSSDLNKVYMQYSITITMLLLWIPVSVEKLIHFGTFRSGILRQPFSDELGYILIYSLPGLEMAIVILLLSSRSEERRVGKGCIWWWTR